MTIFLDVYYRGFIIKGIIFVLFGCGFFIFGILTICALKRNFVKFYRKYFCLLVSANLALAIPTIIRGVVGLFSGLSPDFRQFVH